MISLPKVNNFDVQTWSYHDIVGLDIQVNYFIALQVSEAHSC